MNPWFPFFSMLFWFVTKLAGLAFAGSGIWSLLAQLSTRFAAKPFLLMGIVPLALGWFLLASDWLHDLATAQQAKQRNPDETGPERRHR